MQMKKLERVYLSNNSLSGEIPATLRNITHLGLIDFVMTVIYVKREIDFYFFNDT